jgi:hypothetical protein
MLPWFAKSGLDTRRAMTRKFRFRCPAAGRAAATALLSRSLPTPSESALCGDPVQDFHTPAYSETDVTAGGFGLSYDAKNGTGTRSELGGRYDDSTALNAMPLVLRAKVALANDWVSNPALNASFESLPGSSCTVFGAPIPHELGAHQCQRATVLHAELVIARQVRRRLCLRRANLRRLGNAALHLVSGRDFWLDAYHVLVRSLL